MTDRNIAPQLAPLSIPTLLPYQKVVLDNGTELVYIHDPEQNVFKMDIIFEAGIYYQPMPLTASTAIQMLNCGTRQHSAESIADWFDYHGAYTDFNCGLNKSELSLISLSKYAQESISMLAEMVTDSTIPERELDIYLSNKRQEFLVEREKTAYLARKKFSEVLFGSAHPYANLISEKDYTALTAPVVREFYHNHLRSGFHRIMICGNVNTQVLQSISDSFGIRQTPLSHPSLQEKEFMPLAPGHCHVEKKNAVQSSIRIGKSGVRLTEADYAGFMLLNTILGGYFGSRLMSSIREDKGYTYGIQSFNVSMPQGSYWCISTDVNNEYVEATIEQIFKEIHLLQTELVSEEELTLVKNFMHGDLLREVDGVFAQSDALKHKLNYDTDNRIYAELIRQINACSAEDMLQLANKYLNPAEMYIVTAGK